MDTTIVVDTLQFVFNAPGIYHVTHFIYDSTTQWGCSDSFPEVVFITPASFGYCDASFSIQNNHPNITFNVDNPDTNVLYAWDFGNGVLDTGMTAVLTSPYPGNYTATLIAIDTITNCTDTVSEPYSTSLLCDATFILGNNQGNPMVNFSIFPATGINYTMYFGDGDSATGVLGGTLLQHHYCSNGQFTATFVVYDSNFNCSDTLQQTVTVQNAVPVDASFVNNINSDPTFGFTPLNWVQGTNYQWNFSDGTILNTVSAQKTFMTYGNHDVTLVATNQNGCSDSTTQSVFVQNICNVTTTVINNDPTFTFIANTSNPNMVHRWDLPAGITLYGDTATYTYPYNGSYYYYRFSSDSSINCQANAGVNHVQVNNATPQSCNSTFVTWNQSNSVRYFYAQGQYPAGVSLHWDFDDGTTGSQPQEYHFFDPGTYNVQLTVIDSANQCSDTSSQIVQISGADTGCAGIALPSVVSLPTAGNYSYSFVLQGLVNFSNPYFIWQIDNGNQFFNALSDTFSYTFPDTGVYYLQYAIADTSSLACRDSFTIEVVDSTTHVAELYDLNSSIYPNPAYDLLTVNCTDCNGKTRITVLDVFGKSLIQKQIGSFRQTTLNVFDLPAGVYIVSVSSEGKWREHKFVKQ